MKDSPLASAFVSESWTDLACLAAPRSQPRGFSCWDRYPSMELKTVQGEDLTVMVEGGAATITIRKSINRTA
jgi:hypothetical protein